MTEQHEEKTVRRSFNPQVDRHYFDSECCTFINGWIPYDTNQDAPCFGIWVNPQQRKVLTYAKGDITEVECKNEETFKAELVSMAEFYGPPPPVTPEIDKDRRVE